MTYSRHHFSSIDSTNTWAKRNSHLLDPQKVTLITADEQTKGRGRFTRRWESPAGQNIYATFHFGIDKQRQDVVNVTQVLASTAVAVLEELQFAPLIKWPNDLLLNGKKVAGILCETVISPKDMVVVLGIGLNVNMPLDLLEKIDRPATSLLAESGKLWEVEKVIQKLAEKFTNDLSQFIVEGFSPFLPKFIAKADLFPGKALFFHDGQQRWEGKIHAINADGSLTLELVSGEKRTFWAGEILWDQQV